MTRPEFKNYNVSSVFLDGELPTYTPLMRAANNGKVKILKFLLSKTTFPPDNRYKSSQQNSNKSTVAKAAESRSSSLSVFSISEINSSQCISKSGKKNEDTTENGANYVSSTNSNNKHEGDFSNTLSMVGSHDINGYTALMYAVLSNSLACAQLLAKYEVRLTSKYGKTALMYAAEKNFSRIVKLLRPFEARMSDSVGLTALMYAAFNGFTKCINLLKVEQKMKDKDGTTALMFAALNGHTQAVSLLIPFEKCLANNFGWTALMLAVFTGETACARLLAPYEAGAKNNRGQTAFTIALEKFDIKTAKILRTSECDKYADTNKKNRDREYLTILVSTFFKQWNNSLIYPRRNFADLIQALEDLNFFNCMGSDLNSLCWSHRF